MALTGLRPAREYRNPEHVALLGGAYDVYVQDQYDKADGNQDYYAAKWLRLKKGTYTFMAFADDSARFLLDGTEILSLNLLPTVTEIPLVIQDDGVFRFDAIYRNIPANSISYFCYAIKQVVNGETVFIDTSRAGDFIGDLVHIPDGALGTKPPFNDDVRLTYPVFLPEMNWKDGMTERIEWQTDVMMSETGAEQRRPIRLFPRRTIEASFLRWEQNRTVFDSVIGGVGIGSILLPMWHDQTGLLEGATAGSTTIRGNFVDKDFTVGGVIIIRRDLTWEYEVNIIASMSDDTITLQNGLQTDLIRGTRVFPVKVARMLEGAGGTQLTGTVAQYNLRFSLTEKYDIPPSWGNLKTFDRTGLRIWEMPENWKTGNSVNQSRNSYTFDSESGLMAYGDPGGQNIGSIKKSYTLTGRAEDRYFRELLFMLKGRTRTFHLPQNTNDFILVRDIQPADGALVVRRCGYTQFIGGNQATKRDILIELYEGESIPATIISSRIVGEEEWLFLSQSTQFIPMHNVLRIGYMPIARLDVDTVEIKRLTDGAGVSQVSLTFKTFDDRRQAAPIPIE